MKIHLISTESTEKIASMKYYKFKSDAYEVIIASNNYLALSIEVACSIKDMSNEQLSSPLWLYKLVELICDRNDGQCEEMTFDNDIEVEDMYYEELKKRGLIYSFK